MPELFGVYLPEALCGGEDKHFFALQPIPASPFSSYMVQAPKMIFDLNYYI